jgi:hypothetical protein
LNSIPIGFSFEVFCVPLLCVIRIYTEFFFRRLCLFTRRIVFSGQQRLRCIRDRIFGPSNCIFGPAAPLTYSSQGFGPSNYLFRASSAFDIFESGLRSFEFSLSGQQRLRHIRVRASVPRIISFGPAAPSTYSSQGFGPSSYLFRASSAFDIFESGLWSLELSLSGQQRLRHIRIRASVLRVFSFGPAAPLTYSSQGFGPSSYLFRASSAFDIFESGLRSLELSLSGQQRLRDIRGRASIFRASSFDPIIPLEIRVRASDL